MGLTHLGGLNQVLATLRRQGRGVNMGGRVNNSNLLICDTIYEDQTPKYGFELVKTSRPLEGLIGVLRGSSR